MKIHKIVFIFFVFNLTMPAYSMFMRMRERFQPNARSVSSKVSQVDKTKPTLKKNPSPARLKAASPGKRNTMDALREQVARFLKAQYARLSSLWQKKPIFVEQKELSVPVVPISPLQQSEVVAQMPIEPAEITIQKVPTASIRSAAQAESDAIIAKLNGENPWGYPEGRTISNFRIAVNSPLAEEIRSFFEKNNVDDIENLFSMCVEAEINIADPKYMLSNVFKDLCKKNKAFIVKIFPLVEKNYQRMVDDDLLATILLGLPLDFLPQAEKAIEFFFKKVSYFYLMAMCKPDDMARLLPADSKKLVSLIKIICDNITKVFKQDRFARKEDLDRGISFVAQMFAPKITYIKPDDLRELMEFLLQSEIGTSLFKKLNLSVSLQKVSTASIRSAAQAESDAIIAKLNGENPWGYPEGRIISSFRIAVNSPLAEEIRTFFEKNNVDDIENLFSMCVEAEINIADPKYMLSNVFKDLCKKNKAFIVKIFPLVEKNYQRMVDDDLLATILLALPSDLLPQAEKAIEFFFKKVSYFYLMAMCKPDDMARLLPADSKKLVSLIKIICDNITNVFKQDRFARKEDLDRGISFVAQMFAPKITYIKPDDLRELMEFLLQSEIGTSLFKKLNLSVLFPDYIEK